MYLIQQLFFDRAGRTEHDLALVVAYNFLSSSKLRMLDWALT